MFYTNGLYWGSAPDPEVLRFGAKRHMWATVAAMGTRYPLRGAARRPCENRDANLFRCPLSPSKKRLASPISSVPYFKNGMRAKKRLASLISLISERSVFPSPFPGESRGSGGRS